MSGVHHHDFGFCARNTADSAVGAMLEMMSRKSPQLKVTPKSRSLSPCRMRS